MQSVETSTPGPAIEWYDQWPRSVGPSEFERLADHCDRQIQVGEWRGYHESEIIKRILGIDGRTWDMPYRAMNTCPPCKTCRHWRERMEHGRLQMREGFGECARIVRGIVVTPDNADGFGDEDNGFPAESRKASKHWSDVEPIAPGEAVAMDGSDYFAALITHADFGCTLHEAGEAEAT